MTLYLYVTNDKYELPLIVADSVRELADTLGKSVHTINSAFCRERQGKIKNTRYKKVDVEDD